MAFVLLFVGKKERRKKFVECLFVVFRYCELTSLLYVVGCGVSVCGLCVISDYSVKNSKFLHSNTNEKNKFLISFTFP